MRDWDTERKRKRHADTTGNVMKLVDQMMSPATILPNTDETFPLCPSDSFSLKLQQIINVFKLKSTFFRFPYLLCIMGFHLKCVESG